MRADLTTVVEAPDRYHRPYRHPALHALAVSDLYALFPEQAGGARAASRMGWPETWPPAERAGVEKFLSSDLRPPDDTRGVKRPDGEIVPVGEV